MSQPPEPTEEEQGASPERRKEEDEQRGPGHEDPERTIEPGKESPTSPPPDTLDRVP
jgi:hypothetical protein